MKKITNHTIYEVWNDYTCENVFVDHLPSKEELLEIRKKEKWNGTDRWDRAFELKVLKLKPFYGK